MAVLSLSTNSTLGPTLQEHYTAQRGPISPLREAVGERPHEAHQRVFFLVRKAELSNELGVHVVGELLALACQALDRAEALRAQIDHEGEIVKVKGVPAGPSRLAP